jgi:hypothetical protein
MPSGSGRSWIEVRVAPYAWRMARSSATTSPIASISARAWRSPAAQGLTEELNEQLDLRC